ncbi:tryptophan 2,3-dioxygenase family protein [Salinimicrobium sediminilitoris]|uniref:tryptophan 2,3-dioxygenase family protein n=1 Tax=Salinimicrobium sediminilitoris TaxID=2876715 RepID=UPI001E353387|nr:tryptophan 2,3-dioxygenase family protein [Salinimicrobium sediminilitoris]MCC8359353.1 tryptophan 2,3-dioxygenase [Salinimicrobium sediminilitoris]
MSGIQPEIAEKVKQLEEKFRNSGQDLGSYLDGLLYDKYLTYWDYIELDTLLSLQKPKTHFPDEEIFISYHQITELYFKLVLHELKQLIATKDLSADFFTEKLNRIIRYFRIQTNSFDVMIRGMEREQFLKFRMALLPASGFQSAQFRMIEIHATPLYNLVNHADRENFRSNLNLDEVYQNIYWKRGGISSDTGEKTLTLRQFEEKYDEVFLRLAQNLEGKTLFELYKALPEEERNNKKLIEALRNLDVAVNVNWLLVHIGAAQRYLMVKKKAVKATGGTNWKEFLPPSFQRISFFPELWNEEEKEEWGKQWVEEMITQ